MPNRKMMLVMDRGMVTGENCIVVLDELNQKIIALLQDDPSITNKVLGNRMGVSEVTIAARIRGMEEANILRVMMQRDFRSLGYNLSALIDINVERKHPSVVGHDIARIETCTSVSLALGSPDIFAHFLARDPAHLQSIVDNELSTIEGIASYEINVSLDIIKMDQGYGGLDAQ